MILVLNGLSRPWILVLSWEEKRKAGSTCPQNKIRPLASLKWINIHSTIPFSLSAALTFLFCFVFYNSSSLIFLRDFSFTCANINLTKQKGNGVDKIQFFYHLVYMIYVWLEIEFLIQIPYILETLY